MSQCEFKLITITTGCIIHDVIVVFALTFCVILISLTADQTTQCPRSTQLRTCHKSYHLIKVLLRKFVVSGLHQNHIFIRDHLVKASLQIGGSCAAMEHIIKSIIRIIPSWIKNN